MRSSGRSRFGSLVEVLPLARGPSRQIIVECRRCGATLESREETCEHCGSTRVAVFHIE